ncbi:MAG TPA: cytochrome c maturation protein CcmE [Acidobacteriota bacterium]|nr:cytochrome c maturation protein CcmE [Acidobacteriota bacterium]
MRSTKKKLLITVLFISALLFYLMSSSFTNSVVYYYSVEEFESQLDKLQDRGVRVNGKATSIQKGQRECRFEVVGRKDRLPVAYEGLLPDTFKEGAEVVVEGHWDSGQRHFHATNLLAKCPSKYEGKDYKQGHPRAKS